MSSVPKFERGQRVAVAAPYTGNKSLLGIVLGLDQKGLVAVKFDYGRSVWCNEKDISRIVQVYPTVISTDTKASRTVPSDDQIIHMWRTYCILEEHERPVWFTATPGQFSDFCRAIRVIFNADTAR